MKHTVPSQPRPRQQQNRNPVCRNHGWARREDTLLIRPTSNLDPLPTRQDTGLTMLILLVLTVLTVAGLSRVRSQNQRLEIANEITQLSETRNQLLEKKRVLEAKQATLRHPRQIAKQARNELGMFELPPNRIKHFDRTLASEIVSSP